MKPTIIEASIESQLIEERLSSIEIGEFVSYDDLSEVCKKDVRTSGRGNLNTARNRLRRDKQMVFDPVRGEGIRRANDTEIVAGCNRSVSAIRNAARRGAKRIACARYETLNDAEKVQHNTMASQFGVLYSLTSQASRKALETKVKAANATLPPPETLRAFLGNGKQTT